MKPPNKPPRWAAWILGHLRPRGDADILLGDFEEEFCEILREEGPVRARRWYAAQVLVSLPGFFDQLFYWSLTMIRNYLKVAVRTFRKQPAYTLINTVGLAIGVACCILLFLFVQDEMSFDDFHEKGDRVYRLERIQEVNRARSSFTDGPTGPTLVEMYPDVEAATRTFREESLVGFEDRSFFGEQIAYVDSSFLSIFSFPLIEGDPSTALSVPNSIVLTRSMARKYFDDADPLGQTVRINNKSDFTVTGLVDDVPHNSHYLFDALASFPSLYPDHPYLQNFGSIAVRTYVLLAPGADPGAVQSGFSTFLDQYNSFTEELLLRPLRDVHLRSDVWEIDPQGSMSSVYLFSAIALVILLLACINYVNLSTARSAERVREVGMRKVLGADRIQLIFQYLGESIVLTLAALGIAFLFVMAALPMLNAFLGRPLSLQTLFSGRGMLLVLGYWVVVGLLAGSYPAVYLARFKPARVLKSRGFEHGSGSRLRRLLVVVQFSVSVVLLVSTVVAGLQLRFMQNKDLGFDDEQVLDIYSRDAGLYDRLPLLKQELLRDSGTENVTISGTGVDEFRNSGPIRRADDLDGESEILSGLIFVDEDYIDTFGMTLAAGEAFSRDQETAPPDELVVNASLTRRLGWETPAEAVGQRLASPSWGVEGTIIGVVNDFHIRSFHSPVPAVVMVNERRRDDAIVSVRLRPGNAEETMVRIKSVWSRIVPDWPFEARFLDQTVQQRYARDRRDGELFSVFSGLAVFIACLGLFGLAAFMAKRREKEVGIRKVVGAETSHIVLLLSREFAILVLIAFALASIPAYMATTRWLDQFAFHVDITWVPFAIALTAILLSAWLAIGYQAVHSARTRPVDLIRDE